MDPKVWIIVAAIIIVAIILVVAWIGLRRRRLQSQFGPEYRRVADANGSKWRADSELAARRQRRQKLGIRPLAPEQRDRYAASWQQLQARFVDQPYQAVAEADQLVGTVMRERGYPTENFEQHAADASVDYPELVGNYREGHAVATRQKSANTEELRTAMLHYRALFQELLGERRDGQRAQQAEEVPEREPQDRQSEREAVAPSGKKEER
ncbi:MAG TPA: hypothetical protein VM674_08060 [Candidatus Acidoferrum sp.]|nr:hypothetical protein [Candidatus Acidoferrum sp.]